VTPFWNVLKGWLFLAGAVAVFSALGYGIGGFRLAWIFAFAGLLLGLSSFWVADRAVLGMLGARVLREAENPGLDAMVSELATRAGVVKPKLYVIEHGPPLAFVVGRGIASSSLAVTRSLALLPAPAETQGVIAHELAHVRNRDIVLQTPVVMVSAALIDASRLGGWLERGLLYVLGPFAAALQHLLLSPKRELAADRLAAAICESPHGLADGLLRLDQAAELVEFQASPATEPLFTIDPFEDVGLATMFSSHPPIAERVERLRALDPAAPAIGRKEEAALGRPRE
jgi:heat shock protein HtpX